MRKNSGIKSKKSTLKEIILYEIIKFAKKSNLNQKVSFGIEK